MGRTPPRLVCVTGASGFIAGHIVAQLLEQGFRVRGTIRKASSDERQKLGFLEELKESFSNRSAASLELVEADLLDPASLQRAIDGCTHVVHTASPSTHTAKDPQRDIVEPILRGTKAVLTACARASSVQLLVLTSSISAVRNRGTEDKVFDESDWNDEATPNEEPYNYAKTLGEKMAWQMVKNLEEEGEQEGGESRNKFKLVTFCPTLVVGPLLSERMAVSNSVLLTIASGQYPFLPKVCENWVDVRDVARAHVLAIQKENIAQNQRYILSGGMLWFREAAELILTWTTQQQHAAKSNTKFKHASSCITTKEMANFWMYFVALIEPRVTWKWCKNKLGVKTIVKSDKVCRELGLEYTPLEKTFADGCTSFMERGFLNWEERAKKQQQKKKKAAILFFFLLSILLSLLFALFFSS
ncbi:Cinnamoyl-CoA reductase [Balamuthia mandrillaris]